VALAGAVVVGSGVLVANADPSLPALSAPELLAAVESAHVSGLSGTVIEAASLGLPTLFGLGSAGTGGASLSSLLSGSHTMRVWYAGPDKQRLAVLDTVGETDIFRDGSQVWEWDSDTHTATHLTLAPAIAGQPRAAAPSFAALTPEELANRAIAAIGPSTLVSTDQDRRVAGRSTYELVLSPRDPSSRVGSVRIAVDGKYKVPLSVQIFARGQAAKPAVDVSFSGTVRFSRPDEDNFAFTPPKSAKVQQGGELGFGSLAGGASRGLGQPSPRDGKLDGSGWTTVLVMPASVLGPLLSLSGVLTPVSGGWGAGRLFTSKLLCALITDDGRILIGAVDPAVLYADAASG
jgi:outer membrane lipoprotein-sorting protein